MSVVDYNGRTVDLAAYQGQEPGNVPLAMQLVGVGQSGRILTGINKLSQRFLLELMTEEGTQANFPGRGCQFMNDARTGVWQNTLDVFASFSASLVDITNNLNAEESDDDQDDERFDTAEASNVIFSRDFASINIKITSRAGDSRQFIVPLDVPV